MSSQLTLGKYFLPGLLLIAVVFMADQYSKWLVFEGMLRTTPPTTHGFLDWLVTQDKIDFFINAREKYRTIVVTPFLNLVAVWNQGISFGLFDSNAPAAALAITGFALVATAMLILWLALTTAKAVAFPVSLIAGGALANAVDRIRFGAVADFIDFHAGKYHWPAFNVADSCIVVGAGILMIASFISDRRTHAKTAH